MLEWIFIALMAVAILIFFHNQATYEYKINQVLWTQKEALPQLMAERGPLVVKGVPPVAFWTQQDCMMRECYNQVPVFADKGLSEWLMSSQVDTACPWSVEHARLLGTLSGLDLWTETHLDALVRTNPLWSVWYQPRVSCWAGSRGLWLTGARWTILFVTEGAVQVSIMAGTHRKSLPVGWKSGLVHPSKLTVYDTPFAADLKFLDIILRPGHCLIMPPHWFMSWLPLEGSEALPMVCSVEYHTPVSLLTGK
jgi:hypothetical protein